ncbi:MAG: hypothetical protein BA866_05490 [Desulfobulbaceae bacterium S5133MH15]|nr:MAG: hypothetical protein BA866_05490 [Desulfobulbaceae bacterium S5133MH15]
MSPIDAKKMNLIKDDRIKVTSVTGELERTVKINRDIRSGFIHIPTAYNHNDARHLIQLAPLLDASSNGWDSCQVSVVKVDRVNNRQLER